MSSNGNPCRREADGIDYLTHGMARDNYAETMGLLLMMMRILQTVTICLPLRPWFFRPELDGINIMQWPNKKVNMSTITMRPLLSLVLVSSIQIGRTLYCGWEEAFVVCIWPILSFSFGYCCFNRIINLRPKRSTEPFFSATTFGSWLVWKCGVKYILWIFVISYLNKWKWGDKKFEYVD